MLFHFFAWKFLRFHVPPWKIYESDGILLKKKRRKRGEGNPGIKFTVNTHENLSVANCRNESESRMGENYRGTLNFGILCNFLIAVNRKIRIISRAYLISK